MDRQTCPLVGLCRRFELGRVILSFSLDEWHEISWDLWCDQLLWTGSPFIGGELFQQATEGGRAFDDEVEDALEQDPDVCDDSQDLRGIEPDDAWVLEDMEVVLGAAVETFGGRAKVVQAFESLGFSWDFSHQSWELLEGHMSAVAASVGQMRTSRNSVQSGACLPAAVSMASVFGIISVVEHRQMQRTGSQWCPLCIVSPGDESLLGHVFVSDIIVDDGDGALVSDGLIAFDVIVTAVSDVDSWS